MKAIITKISIRKVVSAAIILSLITIVLFGLKNRRNGIKMDTEYDFAVIVNTYVSEKTEDFVKYEFEVNGKIYSGNQNYLPIIQDVHIGDSCEVIYANTNPKINKLLTDSYNRLKLK